jgi:hypothetical protein
MKARPVKRYRQPAYPTRLEVLSEPELLLRYFIQAGLVKRIGTQKTSRFMLT